MRRFLFCTLLLCSFILSKAQFTSGRLVVFTLPSSTSATSSNAITLNEFTAGGAAGISFVLPITNSTTPAYSAMMANGNAQSDGEINLSPNGLYISIPGYQCTSTGKDVAGNSSTTYGRVAGRMDVSASTSGYFTTVLKDAFSSNNFRSVVSNSGTDFWMAGADGSSSGTEGLRYVLNSGSSSSTATTSTVVSEEQSKANSRTVKIFNGQLYYSSQKNSPTGIYAVGVGLPATATTSDVSTVLPGPTFDTYPNSFVLLTIGGTQVLYVADDNNQSSSAGSIYKYYYNTGTSKWVAEGSYTYSVEGLYGLTGTVNSSNQAVLYATSSDGNISKSTIINVTDAAAATATMSGSLTSTFTTSTSKAYLGIAFTPTKIQTQPANVSACSTSNASLFVTMNACDASSNYSYQWQSSPNGTTWTNITTGSTYTTATSASSSTGNNVSTLTVSSSTALSGTQYRCVITYMGMYALTSAAAILTVNSLPTISFSSAPTTGCQNAILSPSFIAIATGGTSPYSSYAWTGNGITSTTGNTNMVTPILSGTQTYTVIVTDSKGCQSVAASANVMVNPQPSVSFSFVPASGCQNTILTSSFIAAASGGTGSYTYTWTGNGITNPSTTVNTNTATPTTSGIQEYSVIVTDSKGCQSTIANTNITINVLPTSVIDGTASICRGNTTPITISLTGATPWNITYSNGTTSTIVSSTSDSYIFNTSTGATYSVIALSDANGCNAAAAGMTGNAVITVNPYTEWLGTTNTDWNTATNWCGGVPDTTIDALIPAASHYPILSSGNGATKGITIQSGASVTINNSGLLSIAGAISNSGGDFDASTGTIRMCGLSAQTIDGSLFNNRTINNLIICNTSVSLQNTASDTLRITGVLSFGNVNNAIFTTNNNLTLSSTAGNTAMVADITNEGNNTGDTIIGKAVVERYFPSHRSWRLVTAPVSSTNAPTINASWQEGFSNVSRLAPVYSHTSDSVYGTIITKSTVETASGLGTADGFDQGSTNNPSILYYNSSHDWVLPTTAINSGYITDKPGYMLFARGNRDYYVAGTNVPPTSTTLRVSGILNQGPQAISGTGLQVVGNPYASTIYYDGFYANSSDGHGAPGVSGLYYIWDPFMTGSNSVGSFITVDQIGYHAYELAPDPRFTDSLNTPHAVDTTGAIQSGQAIIVNFASGGGNSVIQETDKGVSNDNYSFRPEAPITPLEEPIQQFRANLFAVNSDGTTSLEDGVLNLYNNKYTDSVDYLEDAPKLGNFAETIALLRDAHYLSIEGRKVIGTTDTIFYSLFGMQQKQYIIELMARGLNHPGLSGFLVDSFLNTRTPINLNGNTDIKFSITSNVASSATNRFTAIFIPQLESPLPVTFTSVKATEQNDKNIAVQWGIENQLNIKQYEVGKSTDGINFVIVDTTIAIGNNVSSVIYNWIDNNAVPGNNYYRIASIDNNGTISYSQVVKVNTGATNPGITISQNPIKDGLINLQFTNMPQGVYTIRLFNTVGQKILVKTITHAVGSTVHTISINELLTKGIYRLEVFKLDSSVMEINVENK